MSLSLLLHQLRDVLSKICVVIIRNDVWCLVFQCMFGISLFCQVGNSLFYIDLPNVFVPVFCVVDLRARGIYMSSFWWLHWLCDVLSKICVILIINIVMCLVFQCMFGISLFCKVFAWFCILYCCCLMGDFLAHVLAFVVATVP